MPSSLTAKTLLCSGLGIAILGSSLNLQAAISQQPLSLTEGVSPNLLVTLDDSGSMAWEYAPDGRSGWGIALQSNATNSMYYNPNHSYRLPKRISLHGSGEVVVQEYSAPTDYAAVPVDGFNPNGSTSMLYGTTQSCNRRSCTTTTTDEFFYYRYNVSGSTCPSNPTSKPADSCFTKVSVTGDERKNFAIWYSFYRTRNLATRTAANLAFYTLPENVRLTWGALNTCSIGAGSTSGNCNNNTIQRFAGQHRVNFFNWLSSLPRSGGTPLHNALKRAGGFLQSNTKAYRDDDGSEYSCRASYHILMTDGMWNGQPNGSTNNDGKLDYPYKDEQANTLADWAYYYWATDLRSGLENRITPYMPFDTDDNDPRNNPATWQHMVNFTVGLGLTNALQLNTAPTWSGSTFANHSELVNMGSNGKRWPTVGNDDPDNVYDLWHAAINSRGEFFSADSPDSLVAAFADILSRISERTTSAASPAINSGMQDDGTGNLISYAYQTSYSSEDGWAGDIKGYLKSKTYNPTTRSYELSVEEEWSAKARLAARTSARNIYVASSSSGSLYDPDGLRELSWANAGDLDQPGTLAYYLRQNPDDGDTLEATDTTKAQRRLDFLRGQRGDESALFRTRTTVLGDMIASKPAAVRGARYLTSFAERLHPDSGYADFVTTQQTRAPRVYVGANDGMLHGFDAATGDETFAFVPTAVFPKLHKLTGKSYEGSHHQFYVDGSPVVADVYMSGEWRTVLVGTLRAGGKGLFALDVTDPNNIKLLWEFDDGDVPQAKSVRLGYSFPRPTIARLHNGKWAVVTGNGYESANKDNGKAALLIIDMETGALTKSLEVVGTDGVSNGLSTPKLADFNADGIADFAYAGDMQGNLWRFNLTPSGMQAPYIKQKVESNVAESGFVVSYGGSPLFRAKTEAGVRQPITAAPSIIRHPTLRGYLVVVGTGKYFEEGDKDGSTGNQSIYGIWDTNTLTPTATLQPANLTREELQKQRMDATLEDELNGRGARLLSSESFEWAVPPTPTNAEWDDEGRKYGWYFDLPLNSEMIIEDMVTLGRTLFFQTLVPNADPCSSGVETWTYAIDPQTGGRTLHHAFVDIRSASNADTVISAIRQDGEGGLTIGQTPDSKYELCTGLECEQVYPDPSSLGRQSWRPITE